jgi:hypothetical protein
MREISDKTSKTTLSVFPALAARRGTHVARFSFGGLLLSPTRCPATEHPCFPRDTNQEGEMIKKMPPSVKRLFEIDKENTEEATFLVFTDNNLAPIFLSSGCFFLVNKITKKGTG